MYKTTAVLYLFLLTLVSVYSQQTGLGGTNGKWMTGDFHQHSYYTDGDHTIDEVIAKGFSYGLDFQANSEHGGYTNKDGYNHLWGDAAYYPQNPIKGVYKEDDNGHRLMWRWQSLSEYVYPHILDLRKKYTDKLILTGVEWNVPSHGHCNVMIEDIGSFPYVALFEYLFDEDDYDISNPFVGDWLPEKLLKNTHDKTLAGAIWLQKYFAGHSWLIPTHPERKNLWHVEDLRDLNNAAPDVAFGFEGLPRHQKNSSRGGGNNAKTVGVGTYGGAGYFISKVGGLWDALLGEGRHFFNFVNSDFHDTPGDFWPGEYAKTYVFVADLDNDGRYSTGEVVKGMQSGNSFSVRGNLINALDFTIDTGFTKVNMGQDAHTKRFNEIEVTIAYTSPYKNNNGDKTVVDHIDLIAGEISGKVNPNSNNYTKDINRTTKLLKTFDKEDFQKNDDGWNKITFIIQIDKSMFFRLRGINIAPNTPGETDKLGNPTLDFQQKELDGEAEAWADLWFYSNPIFVHVQ